MGWRKTKKKVWVAVSEEDDNESDAVWTISLTPLYPGWDIEKGISTPNYGYGLPKKLAEWVCDKLNEVGDDCGYHMNNLGQWMEDV